MDKRLSPNREKRVKEAGEENDRIARDFKELKKQGWAGAKLRMHLAQKYKRPIKVINEVTGQVEHLRQKNEQIQRKEEAAKMEAERIRKLGKHGFEPRMRKLGSTIWQSDECRLCFEVELHKNHELKQKRLV